MQTRTYKAPKLPKLGLAHVFGHGGTIQGSKQLRTQLKYRVLAY